MWENEKREKGKVKVDVNIVAGVGEKGLGEEKYLGILKVLTTLLCKCKENLYFCFFLVFFFNSVKIPLCSNGFFETILLGDFQ